MFPAMIAAVMLYGLVRDPDDVRRQVDELSQTLPSDAASLLTTQLEAITSTSSSSLGLGLLISLMLALWSASGGVGNIMTAVNIAYDEEETRGFVKRKLLSIGLTLAAIVFVVVAISMVAVAPALLDNLADAGPVRWGLEAARWVGLVVAMSIALAVLYKVAPDRDDARFRWVSVGAVVATVVWLIASLGFSLYVDNFGSYNKTYGALAGVVVLLLWLWLTMYVVLLGAEINAEAEQQTAKDTTVGPEKPLGERGAVKADSLPGDKTPRPEKP
jgi:membrane protein